VRSPRFVVVTMRQDTANLLQRHFHIRRRTLVYFFMKVPLNASLTIAKQGDVMQLLRLKITYIKNLSIRSTRAAPRGDLMAAGSLDGRRRRTTGGAAGFGRPKRLERPRRRPPNRPSRVGEIIELWDTRSIPRRSRANASRNPDAA
jgi:hypothetical protein